MGKVKKDEIKVLKKAYKSAKTLWKANKEDKKLRKAFKEAKRRYQEAEGEEEEKSDVVESNTPADGKSKVDEEKDTATRSSVVENELDRAKAAWKADRSNKVLREKYLALKSAFENGEAPAATETPPKVDEESISKVFCSNVPVEIDDKEASMFFSSCGNIVDTYWLYDKKTGAFREKGFVTFDSPEAARKACALSGTKWQESTVQIDLARPMKSCNGKMHSGKSCGIYCGNLPADVNKEGLLEFFDGCGTIVDVSWPEDEDGTFKRCAFVTFDSLKSAGLAWKKDGCMMSGYTVTVKPRRPNKKKGGDTRSASSSKPVAPLGPKPPGCHTCFVGNLSFDMSEEMFSEFAGDGVTNIRWLTDQESGKFKGCGFVDFKDDAAIEAFAKKNGQVLCGRSVRIDYAPKTKKEEEGEAGEDAAW
eukprot:g2880.t1